MTRRRSFVRQFFKKRTNWRRTDRRVEEVLGIEIHFKTRRKFFNRKEILAASYRDFEKIFGS